MSRRPRLPVVLFIPLLLMANSLVAAGGASLPNLDARQVPGKTARVSEPQRLELARLRSVLPRIKVDFDPLLGSPRMVAGASGFLTGPSGSGKAVSAGAAARFAAELNAPTKAFLDEHRALFGFGPEALASARVKREYVTEHNGLKTVVWQQQFEGIPVFQGLLVSHTTRRGELVSLSSEFMPALGIAAAAAARNPILTARQALAQAAQNLGERTRAEDLTPRAAPAPVVAHPAEKIQDFTGRGLRGSARAGLAWLPLGPDVMRLCWETVLTSAGRGEMYRVLVDAQTGKVLLRQCLTAYVSDISLRVYTNDSPSPFSPGWPTPTNGQPSVVERSLVTLTAVNTNASPAGWINDGVNETVGNNVDAHTDYEDADVPDLPRPHGSPDRVFDFPLDLSQDPTNYSRAAVVQLFYWNNWMHDRLYELGFTEAAGNFQTDTFGRGGIGNDAVQADAQDSAVLAPTTSNRNNANFSTPPDGMPGRMQMYVFNGPSPNRDGDLDAQVVLHEYAHGLSWRLVGGGQALGDEAQADGMGEGWSDFYALALLTDASEDVHGTFAVGAYSSYKLGGSGDTQNYYFGIRRYPYSTDMAKNPLTYNDIDSAQADNCSSGAPYHSASFGPCSADRAGEVHSVGEVWCVMLWEARANLIDKWGWAIGNQLMLQLVTDGMRLSPPQPNFLDARDAILRADEIDNGGADLGELWAAFARRGLGFSATSPAHSTHGVHEAFDLPDDLRVAPVRQVVSSGPVGGPFDLVSQTFSLTNYGSNVLTWALSKDVPWLSASPETGTLSPGGPAEEVNVSLNAGVTSLASNLYQATVFFTNLASGMVQNRSFRLRVGLPDTFTQTFIARDNDLAYSTTTFTPNGSSSYYAACHEPASAFPTDPTGGTPVALSDDSFEHVSLSGATVSLYGLQSNVFYIGSNGYLTLNSGDSSVVETLENHFDRPRISALFHDLNPGSAGTVSWKQLADRVAVTFEGVPEYGATGPNDFQIEWFFDGRIQLTYLNLSCRNGLVGLSQGKGVPGGFVETDLSGFGACTPLLVRAPVSVREGDGVLVGAGQVQIPAALPTNLTVNLSSSDPSELTVPASVIIPSGLQSAAFDIGIVDDALLNGTRVATIECVAPDVGSASTNVLIYDNETATLRLTLPTTLTEGQGLVQGAVSIDSPPDADVGIKLSSSDPSRLTVPSVVTLAAGQTSAVFEATVPDNLVLDGPSNLTVTAHVQNWIDGSLTVTVLDNENPVALTNAGLTILSESCLPPNHRADPGETVGVNFSVRNDGLATASNVTATLLESGGIASPTGQVTLGDIAPGATVAALFTFQVAVSCGEPATANLQLQHDGTVDLIDFPLPVSGLQTRLAENFDELTPPALPANWTATGAGVAPWCTTAVSSDTPPNAVFAADQITTSENQLVSPPFSVASDTAQLTFRHSYDLEADFDGGRLEISMDGGAFADFVAAGGTFLAGGYSSGGWWSGNSGGYLTTVANLPASAAGHQVRLLWRLTTDGSLGGTGWYLDSIRLTENLGCCLPDDLSLVLSSSPNPVSLGQDVTYSIGVANSGPDPVGGVFVTNTLPAGSTFLRATAQQGSWAQNGGTVVFDLGSLDPGASAALSVSAIAGTAGYLTNRATVAGEGTDPDPSNNTGVCVTRVLIQGGTNTFAAPGVIVIPLTGPGTPYPSTNVVSGLTGNISRLSVTVSNINHSYASDLCLLLAAPSGQNVALMANAGGAFPLADVSLTFDDAAALPVPTTQITSGTYQPAAYSPPEWPAPAPLPPYGTNLAVFNGADPNGVWSLYAYDDAASDSGSIGQGWYLTITTTFDSVPAPRLEALPFSSGHIAFQFETVPGRTYYVEYCEDLGASAWSILETIPGDGTRKTAEDSSSAGRRFYRLRVE